MNDQFQAVLKGQAVKTPPIWMMRQAGRYHKHYQALRAKHSFMDLCKQPELAAQVALGPVEDFDFDVSILFSDLLFPLEGLGMGLEYTDQGPRLGWNLTSHNFNKLASVDQAMETLLFQRDAVRATREILPKNKSLVGFVGGPWTLFVYACEGGHAGSLTTSKQMLPMFSQFSEIMLPLLKKNIAIQFEGGAEIVYIFDTAAGEISPALFKKEVAPGLLQLAKAYPNKIAYYSKGTQAPFFTNEFLQGPWAGMGFDHRWELPQLLNDKKNTGFVQGNFDQSLLHCDTAYFKATLETYLETFKNVPNAKLSSWVCGLGHGVLPKTPEDHVRYFVQRVREKFR